jgi:ATP-dependent exoDNAse (exonuclease V) beta subunit
MTDLFDDLEGTDEAGDRSIEAVRDGAAVLSVTSTEAASLDVALSSRLRQDRALGLSDADAAVLCRTTREADRVRGHLRRDGHPVMDLQDYDGTPMLSIKVGTVKRAKGLEFGRVYLPRIDTYACADGQAERERVERERRELFVAMTRARDGLWTSRLIPEAVALPPSP